MTDFVLTSNAFPSGTSVAAYPVSNWPGGQVDQSAAPVGSAAETKTATASGVTFTTLTTAVPYVAYALVGGVHRYVSFEIGDAGELDPGAAVTQAELTAAVTAMQAYADAAIAAGAPNASATVKGISKLSTAPASGTNPIAVGDNDTRNTNSRAPNGAAGGDLAGTYPNPTLGAGLARETAASSTTGELLATPQSANNDGLVVKGIAGWDGTQAYGKAQAFLLLRDDNSGGDNLYGTTNAAPDRDVLARIDGRTGGLGTSGGAHFAVGLRQHTGFTASQNVWINNYLDTNGLVITPVTNPTGTNSYLLVTPAGGTPAYLKVAANGNVTVQAPAARVRNSANISLATSGTAQTLTFDTEEFDTDAIHSTSSNTSRLTCKTAGVYAISGCIRFASNTTGIRYLAILLNGGTTPLAQQVAPAPGAASVVDLQVSTLWKLAVNDYVELSANQTSGGALNASATTYAPTFSMSYLCDG